MKKNKIKKMKLLNTLNRISCKIDVRELGQGPKRTFGPSFDVLFMINRYLVQYYER